VPTVASNRGLWSTTTLARVEALGLAKHFSVKENYSWGNNEELVLTSCDVGSRLLVRLCDQAGRMSAAIACFHFDFAVRKAKSITGILDSLLN